jgi:hypothetical protein
VTTSLVATTGCFLPARDADERGTGKQPGDYYGDNDVDASTGTPVDGCANPGSSTVRVRVRTTANGGRYAPRNVGAIWIEDGTGKFVQTLEVWANARRRYLTRWRTSSADNTVDAVSGATLSNHTTHDRTWTLDAAARCDHPAGAYHVKIEHTDFNGNGPLLDIPFTMGTPATLNPADQTTFHDLLVELH